MRSPILTAVLACAAALACLPAAAVPFFARAYNMPCQGCHSGYPRLNAFGLAFKANAFRIPGLEGKSPLAWQKTLPLAVQVRPTLMYSFNKPGSVKSQFTDTRLVAGGLATQQTAFYLSHTLFLDGRHVDFPSYELWAQQVLSETGRLMLKAGQFELPFAYSPGANRTTVTNPLLLFSVVNGNDVLPGLPVSGLQLSGAYGDGWQWQIVGGAPGALFNGNALGDRQFFGRFRDAFLRVAHGPPARNAGLFAPWTFPPRDRRLPDTTGDRARRFGLEGTLLMRETQVHAMALYGENSNPFGTGRRGFIRGLFVEADRMIKPWIGVTARYDVQSQTTRAADAWRDAKTLGMRVYPHPLVRVSAEVQFLSHGRSATAFMGSVAF